MNAELTVNDCKPEYRAPIAERLRVWWTNLKHWKTARAMRDLEHGSLDPLVGRRGAKERCPTCRGQGRVTLCDNYGIPEQSTKLCPACGGDGEIASPSNEPSSGTAD